MNRRSFLELALAGTAANFASVCRSHQAPLAEQATAPPAFSVIPVVGDGKWIWTKPPERETGYLEPRTYRREIGIELQGPRQRRPI